MRSLIEQPSTLHQHTSVMFQPPGEGFAHVLVQDNLNAPRFERGDVLLVNLAQTEWRYDGPYVVELHGQQVVRFVQDRGGKGLYVYYASGVEFAQCIPKCDLKILGAVTALNSTRRIA